MHLNPQNFTQDVFSNLKAVLLYGSDTETHTFLQWVFERFLCHDFASSWEHLEEKTFVSNSAQHVAPNLFSVSSQRRCFEIGGVGSKNLTFWKNTITQPHLPFLVLHSTSLKKSNSFVSWFSSQKNVGVFGCYTGQNNIKKHLFHQTLTFNQLYPPPALLEKLASTVSYEKWPHFLEKLILLSKNNKNLEKSVLSFENSPLEESKLLSSIVHRRKEAIYKLLTQKKDTLSWLPEVRLSISFFSRLLCAKHVLSYDKSTDLVLQSLTPPVFFKEVPLFKQALQLWSVTQVEKALLQLSELEVEIKKKQVSFFCFLNAILSIKK